MSFINNYNVKWGAADIIIFLDIAQNAIGSAKYDALGEFFGIDGGTINAAASALELIRFVVLAYQSATHCEAQASPSLSDKG